MHFIFTYSLAILLSFLIIGFLFLSWSVLHPVWLSHPQLLVPPVSAPSEHQGRTPLLSSFCRISYKASLGTARLLCVCVLHATQDPDWVDRLACWTLLLFECSWLLNGWFWWQSQQSPVRCYCCASLRSWLLCTLCTLHTRLVSCWMRIDLVEVSLLCRTLKLYLHRTMVTENYTQYCSWTHGGLSSCYTPCWKWYTETGPNLNVWFIIWNKEGRCWCDSLMRSQNKWTVTLVSCE